MPIVTFNEKDLMRGKIITPAWYRIKIDSVGEVPSKDGGSTNYPIEGTILFDADNGSKDFEGTPITWNFNSKAMGFALGFFQALGEDVKAGVRYDLKYGEGKELDVFVENDTYNGRLVNRVNHKYRRPEVESHRGGTI